MKPEMSPEAVENRLKLVGELTGACLLLRHNSSKKANQKTKKPVAKNPKSKV